MHSQLNYAVIQIRQQELQRRAERVPVDLIRPARSSRVNRLIRFVSRPSVSAAQAVSMPSIADSPRHA
jgi:hypothetical protein